MVSSFYLDRRCRTQANSEAGPVPPAHRRVTMRPVIGLRPTLRRSVAIVLLAVSVGLSCGGNGGGTGDAGALCIQDSECAPPLVCAWQITDGCSAHGQCVPKPQGLCNIVEPPACGCDGTPVPVLCGSPYVTKPVRSRDKC